VCLLKKGGLVVRCPFLLVFLEEGHSDSHELEHESNKGKDETQDQGETQLVRGVL